MRPFLEVLRIFSEEANSLLVCVLLALHIFGDVPIVLLNEMAVVAVEYAFLKSILLPTSFLIS